MSVATTSLATRAPASAAVDARVLPMPPATDADGRPALRLLPAPPCEPPYDDELPEPRVLRTVRTEGAFALARRPGPAVVLRLVPRSSADLAALTGDDDEDVRRTPLTQLPAARPFAQALVQRLLEVLAGLRPVSQLQSDTSFELFSELEQELAGRVRSGGARPSRRDVRSVHVQEHEQGVAEVCATVRSSGRVSALAMRLEGVDGGWRCTALLGL